MSNVVFELHQLGWSDFQSLCNSPGDQPPAVHVGQSNVGGLAGLATCRWSNDHGLVLSLIHSAYVGIVLP